MSRLLARRETSQAIDQNAGLSCSDAASSSVKEYVVTFVPSPDKRKQMTAEVLSWPQDAHVALNFTVSLLIARRAPKTLGYRNVIPFSVAPRYRSFESHLECSRMKDRDRHRNLTCRLPRRGVVPNHRRLASGNGGNVTRHAGLFCSRPASSFHLFMPGQ